MTPIPRDQIYAIIDGERDYQDSLSASSETAGVHTVPEWVLYMEAYIADARQIAAHTWGSDATFKTLDVIRKVTAMGVACMEQNGFTVRAER